MKSWGGTTQIVIKTIPPSALGELPVSKKHGRGRFVVNWGDREAAQQLVDSIVRPSLPPQARAAGRKQDPRMADPRMASTRIQAQVLVPAIGLLLTGIIALISSFVFFVGLMSSQSSVAESFSFLAFPAAAGASIVIIGALRMMKLQSHQLVMMAVALALLPWSPGWILGLPFGIWAVIVLRRPEIVAAFSRDYPGVGPNAIGTRALPGSGPGRFGAFFRSVGRYCLTAFSGRHAVMPSAETASKDVADRGEKPKFPETVDYPDSPANQ
jgi:hypothetical protein